MKKSIIRSVPYNILPTWLKKKLIDVGRPNLNPWIRDEHQDIQYFLNVDFHQDMTRGNKFCTFYIYLDDEYCSILSFNTVMQKFSLRSGSVLIIASKQYFNTLMPQFMNDDWQTLSFDEKYLR